MRYGYNDTNPMIGVAIVILAVCVIFLLTKCGSRTGFGPGDFNPNPTRDDAGQPCIVGNWDETAPECECGEYQNKAWANRVHAGCRVLGCEYERTPAPGEMCVVDTCCAYGSRP